MKSFSALYFNRRMAIVLLLGFSSGLPLDLIGDLLKTWLTTAGLDIKTIAFFGLVGNPYTYKFLWSPLMDRFVPTFFGRPFLGRRRGWMIITQLLLAVAIALLGCFDPHSQLALIGLCAVVIAFLSASQDIVLDAYRTELLARDELGAGAGLAVLGYRIGMLTAGGVGVILGDYLSWQQVYFVMAGLMSVGIVTTLAAPEPEAMPPRTFMESVIHPFRDFLARPGVAEICLFILIYKLGDVLAASLLNPFLIKTGFSLTEIGSLKKLLGIGSVIIGSLIGGWVIAQIGLKRSLIWLGIAQGVTILAFSVLALGGANLWLFGACIIVENLGSGLGNAGFIAFLMGLCDRRFTATQYALLSSFAAVSRVYIAPNLGWLPEQLGWAGYFALCALIAVPGVVLVALRFDHWGSGPATEK